MSLPHPPLPRPSRLLAFMLAFGAPLDKRRPASPEQKKQEGKVADKGGDDRIEKASEHEPACVEACPEKPDVVIPPHAPIVSHPTIAPGQIWRPRVPTRREQELCRRYKVLGRAGDGRWLLDVYDGSIRRLRTTWLAERALRSTMVREGEP